MNFIEAPYFTEIIVNLISDEEYKDFQAELARNPQKGDLIPHTGGARKIRLATKGKGKQKGSRIIYYYQFNHETIWLLFVYEKGKQENLSYQETKAIARTVSIIKETII